MRDTPFQPLFWIGLIGTVVSIVGAGALALSFLRRKRTDVMLMNFGAASLLYGIRLLLDAQLQRYVTIAPPRPLIFLVAFISYVIVIPFSGFFLHLFGKGWRNSVQWAFRAWIVFAGAGIMSDVIRGIPFSLEDFNNILVVVWACVVLINAILLGPKKTVEIRVVSLGFLVFGIFALNENLVSLGLLPWDWQGERYGFLIFLATLGFIAARRYFRTETRLSNMERELEIARQIQSSLLPQTLPTVHGLRMAALFVPMASVAGDYYDVLAQDERRLCLLIGDVSGHGMGAALIASMLKIAFASQQARLSRPDQVLAGINQALSGKLDNNFITAACLFLDTQTKELRYAAAGHPPLILYRRQTRRIHELSENGLILGPFPEATFPLTTMALEPGDRIIAYTDGIVETRKASGEFFGDAGLKAFIQDKVDLSPDSFVSQFLEHLSDWSGKPSRRSLDDDLTMVILDVS